MGKSIFDFYNESPWGNNWVEDDKNRRSLNPVYNNYTRFPNGDSSDDLLNEIISFSKSVKLFDKLNFDNKMIAKIKVKFGSPESGFRAEIVPNGNYTRISKIVINKDLQNQYFVPKFSQLLFMEWGNAKNFDSFIEIVNNSGNYSRDQYMRAIELLEFNVRVAIIKSYLNNEFDNVKYVKQECAFDTTILDFEDYYASPKGKEHREKYGRWWDEDNKD